MRATPPHPQRVFMQQRRDEAATFGRLGLAVEEGDQRLALQLLRDEHRASDGGADAVHRGLNQHAVEAEPEARDRSGVDWPWRANQYAQSASQPRS